jgi:hypothetical protein
MYVCTAYTCDVYQLFETDYYVYHRLITQKKKTILPTACIYWLHIILRRNAIIPVNRLVFVIDAPGLFSVRYELNF